MDGAGDPARLPLIGLANVDELGLAARHELLHPLGARGRSRCRRTKPSPKLYASLVAGELRVVLDRLAVGRLGRLLRVPEVQQSDEALFVGQADRVAARPPCAARRACASSPPAPARARPAARCRRPPRPACRSSSSCTGSGERFTEQTTRVGARSSFAAATRASSPGSAPAGAFRTASSPAASFSRSRARGPTTRNRQGFVRLWLGAQRASSSSSSSVSRSTGRGSNALTVRRERIASSVSMPRG